MDRVRVTARLPDDLTVELDAAAQRLNRCRADVIHQAIEYYFDDIEDLWAGVAALTDPLILFSTWLRCVMRCSPRIKRSAAKAFEALLSGVRPRFVAAIDKLCDVPAAGSALKGEFEGLRRLRVGRYRIVYEWPQRELVVLVVRVVHRKHLFR